MRRHAHSILLVFLVLASRTTRNGRVSAKNTIVDRFVMVYDSDDDGNPAESVNVPFDVWDSGNANNNDNDELDLLNLNNDDASSSLSSSSSALASNFQNDNDIDIYDDNYPALFTDDDDDSVFNTQEGAATSISPLNEASSPFMLFAEDESPANTKNCNGNGNGNGNDNASNLFLQSSPTAQSRNRARSSDGDNNDVCHYDNQGDIINNNNAFPQIQNQNTNAGEGEAEDWFPTPTGLATAEEVASWFCPVRYFQGILQVPVCNVLAGPVVSVQGAGLGLRGSFAGLPLKNLERCWPCEFDGFFPPQLRLVVVVFISSLFCSTYLLALHLLEKNWKKQVRTNISNRLSEPSQLQSLRFGANLVLLPVPTCPSTKSSTGIPILPSFLASFRFFLFHFILFSNRAR